MSLVSGCFCYLFSVLVFLKNLIDTRLIRLDHSVQYLYFSEFAITFGIRAKHESN